MPWHRIKRERAMPRKQSEPRLYLDRTRGTWVVRYRGMFHRTQYSENQRAEAEDYLKRLLTSPQWTQLRAKATPQGMRIGKRAARSGVLYFVSKVGCDTYPIKVGFCASDVDRRLIDIQTGNPERLEVVAACSATFGNEMLVHQLLAESRISGEWFNRTDAVMAAVNAARSGDISGWISTRQV